MKRKRQEWTEEQLVRLVEAYAETRTSDLAAELGRTISSVYVKANSLGLLKSERYLASPDSCRLRRGDNVGAATRFKRGQTSWNKGRPMPTVGRSAETQFKKGQLSGSAAAKLRPIGTERISKDGYLERKINDDLPAQRRWRAVHLLVWEAAHGPMPPGHAVIFIDGDKTNRAIENLQLISRGELMRRNSYHTNYPKEVAQLIQLKGALQRKINRRTRREEQNV